MHHAPFILGTDGHRHRWLMGGGGSLAVKTKSLGICECVCTIVHNFGQCSVPYKRCCFLGQIANMKFALLLYITFLYFMLPHFLYVWVPIQMEIKPSSQMDILCYGSTHTHTPMHACMHARTHTHKHTYKQMLITAHFYCIKRVLKNSVIVFAAISTKTNELYLSYLLQSA